MLYQQLPSGQMLWSDLPGADPIVASLVESGRDLPCLSG